MRLQLEVFKVENFLQKFGGRVLLEMRLKVEILRYILIRLIGRLFPY